MGLSSRQTRTLRQSTTRRRAAPALMPQAR